MRVTLNGEATDLDESVTLDALLKRLNLAERRVAIELNGAIVPRSLAASTRLAAGDAVEIVHAIGGG